MSGVPIVEAKFYPLVRYGLAIVFVLLALLMTLSLHYYLLDRLWFLFFAAVMASAKGTRLARGHPELGSGRVFFHTSGPYMDFEARGCSLFPHVRSVRNLCKLVGFTAKAGRRFTQARSRRT